MLLHRHLASNSLTGTHSQISVRSAVSREDVNGTEDFGVGKRMILHRQSASNFLEIPTEAAARKSLSSVTTSTSPSSPLAAGGRRTLPAPACLPVLLEDGDDVDGIQESLRI